MYSSDIVEKASFFLTMAYSYTDRSGSSTSLPSFVLSFPSCFTVSSSSFFRSHFILQNHWFSLFMDHLLPPNLYQHLHVNVKHWIHKLTCLLLSFRSSSVASLGSILLTESLFYVFLWIGKNIERGFHPVMRNVHPLVDSSILKSRSEFKFLLRLHDLWF